MDICYGEPLPLTELKAAGDGWEVSGYASTFNNTDLGGDVVVPGAFDGWLKGLQSGQNKTRFLFSHQSSQILGRPLEIRADDHGLYVRAKISKTTLGQDVHTLLEDKALDSFSIGYRPTDIAPTKDGGRYLKTVELPEFSLVAMPMNDRALVTGFKGRFCHECGELLDKTAAVNANFGSTPDGRILPLTGLNTDAAFDDLIAQVKGHVMHGVEEAEALHTRRVAEQRKLSDTHIDALVLLNAELKGSNARIEAILNAARTEPAVKANGALGLRLELARRRARAAGALE